MTLLARPNKTTQAELDRFIELLSEGRPVRYAAHEIGRHPRTLYRVRDGNPAFRAAWERANEEGVQVLEEEARRRAVDGWEEPTTIAGEREVVRKFSDTLLIFLLKAKRPTVYRENVRHEHDVTVTVDVTGARERVAELLAARGGGGVVEGRSPRELEGPER